jgi:hypothetical protein
MGTAAQDTPLDVPSWADGWQMGVIGELTSAPRALHPAGRLTSGRALRGLGACW